MCKIFLNGRGTVAMTLTYGHRFIGNILEPRDGYREMGVLVVYEL